MFLAGLSAPPAPFVPAELHFTPAFALAVVGLGDDAAHAKLIAPIKEALTPDRGDGHAASPTSRCSRCSTSRRRGGCTPTRRRSTSTELTDGAIDAIVEHQPKKMSPLSFVPIFVLGGAYQRADSDASAFGGSRDIRYVINISATTPTRRTASRPNGRGCATTGRRSCRTRSASAAT